uniref:Uncharacterized protein n=1 Tax=Oryza brachyantha TaxID=4533 RepID=J3M4B6_ORYBR
MKMDSRTRPRSVKIKGKIKKKDGKKPTASTALQQKISLCYPLHKFRCSHDARAHKSSKKRIKRKRKPNNFSRRSRSVQPQNQIAPPSGRRAGWSSSSPEKARNARGVARRIPPPRSPLPPSPLTIQLYYYFPSAVAAAAGQASPREVAVEEIAGVALARRLSDRREFLSVV